MNVIMMLAMLFCLYGMAGFLYMGVFGRKGGTVTSAQCMTLSVMLIIGVQALFSLLGRILPHAMSIGVGLLLILGIYGHFLLLYGSVRASFSSGRRIGLTDVGKARLKAFYSPALICVGAVFVLTLFLMRGMLVFRYDDLKQWGSAAKFMVEHEAMPREEEFFGSLNHYLTPTFFTSFFGIGGKWVTGKFVEYVLYAANLLYAAVGMALPLGEFGWKDAKRCFVIFGLSVFGITALYYHTTANLYVDITLSAWVGGMVGFLLLRRRIRGQLDWTNLLYLALTLLFTVFIKWGYGILGVVIVLCAWGIIEYSMRRSVAEKVNRLLHNRRFWLCCGGIILLGAVMIWLLSIIFGRGLDKVLPGAGSLITSVIDILFGRSDKAVLTTNACLLGLFDQKVTRGTFGFGAAVALVLLGGLGYLQCRSVESVELKKLMHRLHTAWLIGSVIWFLLILVTYVSNFAYAEATIALSFNRYMGIYLMIGYFVLVLLLFCPEQYLAARKVENGETVFVASGKQARGVDMRSLMRILLIMVLVLNMDSTLMTESTGLNSAEMPGYANVSEVAAQSKTVKKLTTSEDDILFIAQSGAERSLHRARFDVGMNVSGYKPNTYHFSSTADAGYDLSAIRPPEELPTLLIEGGYEYVWLFRTDSELNAFAKEYFGFKLQNGTLYRVWNEGGIVSLTEVSSLE